MPPCARQRLHTGDKAFRLKVKIVFIKWHDKQDVSVISTNLNPNIPDVVIQRCNEQVPNPAVIGLYNENMGGGDLTDAGKHFCEKVNGRRKQCVRCKVVGINTPSGWAVETSFQCLQCGEALCQVNCFNVYHAVNLVQTSSFPESFTAVKSTT